jgi:hypothetical protein
VNWHDRIDAYAESVHGRKYPDSIPRLSRSGRWVEATWILGQNYRAKAKLYGSYPPQYLDRMGALFPDVRTDRTLHVFAGCVPEDRGIRIDLVRRDVLPTIQGDVQNLPFRESVFPLVFADPPYSSQDAKRYDVPMVNRRKALAEIARVTVSGGTLAWMDTQVPMFAKRNWKWVGNITLIRSTNHRVRIVSLFEAVS